MNERTRFLVLRQTDYRETDMIVSGLAPQGQVSFLVRGARKIANKNAYALQLYTESRIEYDENPNRDIQLCKTAAIEKANRYLREDLNCQVLASVSAELLLKLPDGNDLFDLCASLFERLAGKEKFTAFNLFLSLLLRREGSGPLVDGCAVCGRTDHIQGISVKEGGFVCQQHLAQSEGKTYPVSVLRAFRLINKAGNQDYERLEAQGADDLQLAETLLRFIESYMGIELRSHRFFTSWFGL